LTIVEFFGISMTLDFLPRTALFFGRLTADYCDATAMQEERNDRSQPRHF
jgi:hypothetical protein